MTAALPFPVIAHWPGILALATALLWMVRPNTGFEHLLRLLAPGQNTVIYPGVPLRQLLADQIYLVAFASSISIVSALRWGFWRSRDRDDSFGTSS